MIKKTLILFIGCLAVLLVFLPAMPAGGASLDPGSDATPRPTVHAPPKPVSEGGVRSVGASGAEFLLQTDFADDWPWWTDFSWQSLWTVVEWQGPDELWYEVDGWRGNLDSVTVDADSGAVTGWRLWWVDKTQLGQGPFRWKVYESEGGSLLTTSSQFYLPPDTNTRVIVEVELVP